MVVLRILRSPSAVFRLAAPPGLEFIVKLSILMPVYNEERRAPEAVKQALAVDYPCDIELIVVDDGSKDRTPEMLGTVDDPRMRLVRHERNLGKGAAVRTGAGHAKGDYLVILDADLEYDPQDIPRLLEPVLDRRATVVYGSRTFGSHTAYSFWYVMGNKMVTMAANVLFNSYISDLETGYKLMPVDLYRSLSIRSKGFGMEAETTGKLLRSGIRPYEIPISYRARSREEGKKITWMDGVDALRILMRERVRRPSVVGGAS
jgi:glycosyltransferase involved in cell wall biosynthesis